MTQHVDLSTEQAVIGAVLLEPHRVADLILSQGDFLEPVNGMIWALVQKALADGVPIEPLALADLAKGKGDITLEYLDEVLRATGTAENVTYHAGLVRNKAKRRRLIEVSERTAREARKEGAEVESLMEQNSAALSEIAIGTTWNGLRDVDTDISTAIIVAEEAREKGGQVVGLKTGLVDLDKRLNGLKAGSLNILAARPSMGKTAMALNITDAVLRQGANVAFYSLESGRLELIQRLLAADTGLDLTRIINGNLTEDGWSEFLRGRDRLRQRTEGLLKVDDGGILTPEKLRASLRRISVKGDIGLVVVDYLQLMTVTRASGRFGNRVQEVTEISRGLKLVAKEFNTPVLALSQLSRAIEGRMNAQPRLSDLRDSGSIEQDADTVTFIHRERDGGVTIHIAKNRNGPIGEINSIDFAPTCVRFFTKKQGGGE